MGNLECLGAVLDLGVVKTEKFYLQIVGLEDRASTGDKQISKWTLIVGWNMCYERDIHRLLQKQERVYLVETGTLRP